MLVMSKLRVSPFPNNPKQNLASHPSCRTGTAFKNYAALRFSLPSNSTTSAVRRLIAASPLGLCRGRGTNEEVRPD